jgi:hypothetical protein
MLLNQKQEELMKLAKRFRGHLTLSETLVDET